jgi:regulator of sigma E protease
MQIIWTIFAFMAAISILVAVHEWGHFLVARFFNIKVLRFSIGFGKALYTWRGKDDTEYVLAAIPLGGYVKMLDEKEGPVPEHLLPRAFNRQHVLKRIAVVAAGPMFNFLFAILALWISFMVGVKSIVPMIGEVLPSSIAYEYGLRPNQEIQAINNKPASNWGAVYQQIFNQLSDKQNTLDIEVLSEDKLIKHVSIPVSKIQVPEDQKDILSAIGFASKIPDTAAVIGQVLEGEAADLAGFKAKDRVISINNTQINTWQEFVNIVKKHPDKDLNIVVKREEKSELINLNLTLKPRTKIDELTNKPIGYAGLLVDLDLIPEFYLKTERYGVFQGLKHAVAGTGLYIYLSFKSIKEMIVGQVSLDNLGGPIMIANIAGKVAQQGITTFLGFLAQISIGLGILNLLPIPALDGGHLFYYMIELVTRKPLSEKIQLAGYKFGLLFLLFLMTFAFYNDILRLFK